jgi:hypothetical protein
MSNAQPSPTPTAAATPNQWNELIQVLKEIRQGQQLPPPPIDDTSELVVKWFESFLPATIGIATVGSSVTFTTIVSQLQDPARLDPNDPAAVTPTVFHRETVRTFLATSWLLFVIALGFASFATLLLNFHRGEVKEGFSLSRKNFGYEVAGILVSFILETLLLGAFLFLALALVAYSQTVGWIAVGFTSAFALAGFGLCIGKILYLIS